MAYNSDRLRLSPSYALGVRSKMNRIETRIMAGIFGVIPVFCLVMQTRFMYTQHLLSKSHETTVGHIDGPSGLGHGIQNYSYIVNGEKYRGSSQVERYFSSSSPDQPVHYSPQHPSYSSMNTVQESDTHDWIQFSFFLSLSVILYFIAFVGPRNKNNANKSVTIPAELRASLRVRP